MAANLLIGNISAAAVDGGDAEEMQTRLRELFAGSTNLFLADISLAGTGDGPRWLCEVTRTDNSNTFKLAPMPTASVFVVRAGNPEELQFKILETLTGPLSLSYVAIRVAGASSGRDYMAV